MLHYRFGGLQLSSNAPLPGLRSTGNGLAVDVEIDICAGAPPRHEQVVHAWGGRYGLRLGRIGPDWSIDSRFGGIFLLAPDGRHIRAVSESPTLSPGLIDVLSRRILPRMASFAGATAIHAASLGKGASALLLLGHSGAGKSTLSAALARRAGWQILSDDISVVRDDGAPQVEPCTTGICVWSDSQAGLGLDPATCVEMAGYEGKVRYHPAVEDRISSARLSAGVVLHKSASVTRPQLERLGPAGALMAAIRQLVLFNPADAQKEGALQVGRLAGIMAKIPAFRLTYPENYSALPEVTEMLEGLLPT